jgi:hypothetical protein
MKTFKTFEEKEHTGVLSEFLENIKPHRIEAIYNKEYRYIAQIIWDDELNEKYGSKREGYERFKSEQPGYVTHSGEIDLRVWRDHNGEELGYMTETKLNSNESYKIINEQFHGALKKTKEILDVKDHEAFDYWLNNEVNSTFRGPNECISAIKRLQSIIERYNEDMEFRAYLDKIKG